MAIKVMIVDDSNFMRKAIASLISTDRNIEVVSLVSSGEEALEKISQVEPDVITLDFNLPGMDGIETLDKIMADWPTPVIMLSGYTKKGADVTLKALSKGAIDFVAKPHGCLSPDLSTVKDELVGKIIAASMSKMVVKKKKLINKLPEIKSEGLKLIRPDKSLLFIAASTGGVQALGSIIPSLPENFPIPILVVQHMPPLFTKSLALSLDKESLLHVREAVDGDDLRAGTVLIAPGGWHSRVVNTADNISLKLDKEPSDLPLRPSADVSMRSIASVYGRDSVAVILTGMGNDGTAGGAAMKKAGGIIIAQDRGSSTIYGMPRSVVEAGLADSVLPLDEIAHQITGLL
ncbi:MAG: chemotaxis response regulator protein-glutamate methylesterase [bacterium]|nr:chemotaxis response regulator protein-glutamate methylesterase [bacterium]